MTLSIGSVFTVALFLLLISCGMVGTWLVYLMRTEVNSKLDPSKQLSPLGGTTVKLQRIRQLHREMYPESKLRIVY